MNTRLKGQSGMSLVEATIILLVLATLTATLAPSITTYLEDARKVKAKEDVEAIGMSIIRLLNDTGNQCLLVDPGTPVSQGVCSVSNRVDLLLSGDHGGPAGKVPSVDCQGTSYDSPPDCYFTYANTGVASDATGNWFDGNNKVPKSNWGFMDDQLVTNDFDSHKYKIYQGFGHGWRGSYITGPTGSDPWNYPYQANTVFLGIANDAPAGTGDGQLAGAWAEDVVVLSGGPNGSVNTQFGGTPHTGSEAGADDIIYTIGSF